MARVAIEIRRLPSSTFPHLSLSLTITPLPLRTAPTDSCSSCRAPNASAPGRHLDPHRNVSQCRTRNQSLVIKTFSKEAKIISSTDCSLTLALGVKGWEWQSPRFRDSTVRLFGSLSPSHHSRVRSLGGWGFKERRTHRHTHTHTHATDRERDTQNQHSCALG